MTDEECIRRTLAQYSQLCDDGRFDDFALLFTDDAVFRVLGTDYAGRGAIRGFMTAAQPAEARGRHVTTNSVIVVDGDHARAWTDYVFVARVASGGFAITNIGRYHDLLVRDASDGTRWRFARREIVFMGDDVTPDYPV